MAEVAEGVENVLCCLFVSTAITTGGGTDSQRRVCGGNEKGRLGKMPRCRLGSKRTLDSVSRYYIY